MINPPQLIIHGQGGHSQVVADAAKLAGCQVMGFIQEPVDLSDASQAQQLLEEPGMALIVAVGDNAIRQRITQQYQQAGHTLATVIHPTAIVSPAATLGPGVYIGPRAVLNANARIDIGVIINTGAIVEHGCHIHDYAHLAPRSVVAGSVEVGAMSLIGLGATVLPNLKIAANTTLGAGTVLTHSVTNENQTWVGVPGVGLPSNT